MKGDEKMRDAGEHKVVFSAKIEASSKVSRNENPGVTLDCFAAQTKAYSRVRQNENSEATQSHLAAKKRALDVARLNI